MDCRATLRSELPHEIALQVDHGHRAMTIVAAGECRIELGERSAETPSERLAERSAQRLGPGDVAVVLRETAHTLTQPANREAAILSELLDSDSAEWRRVRGSQTPAPGIELVLAAFPRMNPILARLCSRLPELLVVHRASPLGERCDWLRRTLVKSADRAELGGGYVRSHLARLLLWEILRSHLREAIPLVDSWDRLLADPEVATACLAMLEALDQDWTVARLTRETQVARCTLARKFQRAVGRSPAEWLRSVRIARATGWLRSRDDSVESIARRAGYQSSSGFRAAYQRATGTSPSESRE